MKYKIKETKHSSVSTVCDKQSFIKYRVWDKGYSRMRESAFTPAIQCSAHSYSAYGCALAWGVINSLATKSESKLVLESYIYQLNQ